MGRDNDEECEDLDSREALTKEDKESKEDEALLEDHVLAFLILLLDHHLKDDEYRSVLVSAAAVLGVDSNRG